MKNLMTNVEMVDYYFQKVEAYLGKKHRNILRRGAHSRCDSVCSGSPKSTLSDRVNTFEEEEKTAEFEIREEPTFSNQADNNNPGKQGENSPGDRATTTSTVIDLEEESVLFKDFTEPDILKTGYLLPVSCGHNGMLSMGEKTIFEIHLTNAGFLREADPTQRSSEIV